MTDKQQSKINKFNILIAIIISFVAWVFVVYNYAPMKNVVYRNVPITYVGELDLVQNGLGIESALTDTVDVTLNINRKNFNNISVDDILAEVDVGNVVEGSNGLSISITPPDGASLESISTSTVTIEVASGANKDVEMTAVYDNASDASLEPVTSEMSYEKVSVLGAADNVAKVKCAVLRVNEEDLISGPKSFVVAPVALDKDGREVKHIVVLPSEISFKANAASTKEVELVVPLKNGSHEDTNKYEIPDTVTIKGATKLLKTIDKIEANPVDVTGITEETRMTIDYILPEGIQIAQASLGNAVKVVVK